MKKLINDSLDDSIDEDVYGEWTWHGVVIIVSFLAAVCFCWWTYWSHH